MCLVYITLARKILCYGSFPAKVSLGTNAYNSQKLILAVTVTVILPMNVYGQQADCDSLSVKNRGLGNYEFKWRQTILPASLIGAGAVALVPGLIRNGSREKR